MPKAVTVFDREREFAHEGFYIFDKVKRIMVCKFCNVRIDWKRKDSCIKHIRESASHVKNKKTANKSVSPTKRQVSLGELAHNAKQIKKDKEDFIMSTVNAFVHANIPLEKLDEPGLRTWMNRYITGAGDLPQARVLRQTYVPKLHAEYEQGIKENMKDVPVAILCDETTDRNGRCVFVVLFKVFLATSTKLYVAGIKVLSNANATECSRAILDILQKYEIAYDNIVCVVSDSARYMTKCVDTLKVIISEDLLHVQCWAHKLNIVGNFWPANLTELNEFIAKTKSSFLNTRKRKHAYLEFLRKKYPDGEKEAKLFPSPVLTRWNSWYGSVCYACEYLTDIVEFFSSYCENSPSAEYFKHLSKDTDVATVIQCQAFFVVDHCAVNFKLITTLEGSEYPYVHKLHHQLQDLVSQFGQLAEGIFSDRLVECLGTLNTTKSASVKHKLCLTSEKCRGKLLQLILNDPAKTYILTLGKLFDKRSISISKVDDNLAMLSKKVPFFSNVKKENFLSGYAALQNSVKDVQAGHNVEIIDILKALTDDHPEFAFASIRAIWVPVSNVDCERAFSAYGCVHSDRRTTLKPENLELFTSLYFTQDLH